MSRAEDDGSREKKKPRRALYTWNQQTYIYTRFDVFLAATFTVCIAKKPIIT